MTYRVYVGPPGTKTPSPLEQAHWLHREFSLLHEALVWARRMSKGRRVALLIEGDDGTHLNRSEIAAALRHSKYKLARHPEHGAASKR